MSNTASMTRANEAPSIESRPEGRRDIAIVVVATLLFAGALALRQYLNVWATIGGSSLLLVITALSGRAALPVFGKRGAAFDVFFGLAGAGLLALATHALYPLAADLIPGLGAQVDHLYADLRDWPGPLYALPLLMLAVIAEELVWRGVLMRQLRWRKSFVAVIIATAAYAIPQVFSGSWVLVAAAVGCGFIWTAMRAYTGGITAPALCHAGWNLVAFVFLPLD